MTREFFVFPTPKGQQKKTISTLCLCKLTHIEGSNFKLSIVLLCSNKIGSSYNIRNRDVKFPEN